MAETKELGLFVSLSSEEYAGLQKVSKLFDELERIKKTLRVNNSLTRVKTLVERRSQILKEIYPYSKEA